jgi:hypothetical protein
MYIRCVLSGGTSNDWIETNIHCDVRIQWMIFFFLIGTVDDLISIKYSL